MSCADIRLLALSSCSNTEYIAGVVFITEMLSIKIAMNFPLKLERRLGNFHMQICSSSGCTCPGLNAFLDE
jgi:hypothetical protein